MDPFETELASLVATYELNDRIQEGIRKQRRALSTHSTLTSKGLVDRFGLSPDLGQRLIELGRLAGGEPDAVFVEGVRQRTVWEQGPDQHIEIAMLAAPPRKVSTTVGPGMIAPHLEPSGVATDLQGQSWAVFARGKPEHPVVLARFSALAGLVGGYHLLGETLGCLDPDNLLVGDDGESAIVDRAAEPSAAYRSPEQVLGQPLRPVSDVFVLGVLLFEALTGVSWFNRVGVSATHEAVLSGDRREHEREVPSALLAVCMRATRRDPEHRPQSAVVLLSDVMAAIRSTPIEVSPANWDPVISLRERGAAAKLAGRGVEAAEFARQAHLLDLEKEREDAVWLRELGRRLAAGDGEARPALAAGLVAAHKRAVKRGETADVLLDALHEIDVDHRYATYCRGEGRLTILTEPPGVTADLYHYEEREGRLWPIQERGLGTTPVQDVSLAIGSYIVILRGNTDVRYPVQIERRTRWHGMAPDQEKPTVLPVPTRGELGQEDVVISAGWFKVGRSARWTWCDSFVIRKTPIRTREYIEFLSALKRSGDEEQLARCTFRAGPTLGWEGTTAHLEPDSQGQIWSAEWPAVGVPIDGARQFARWRGSLDGHSWRLPTEREWEKAARGVDGRLYPWGHTVDPSFARCGSSTPVSVDEMPADSSPYGVRGMAGNAADWVDAPSPEGFALAKGGSFASRVDGLATTGARTFPADGALQVSFRLARKL